MENKSYLHQRRPATPIEIEMMGRCGHLVLPADQKHRRLFLRQLASRLLFRSDAEGPVLITDAEAAFLARTVWRFRHRMDPALVLAAALKGGTEKSKYQVQTIAAADRLRVRLRALEEHQQWSLFDE